MDEEDFVAHQKRLATLAASVSKLAAYNKERELKEQQEKIQKFLIEVQTKNFEKAQAYVNVIILAGYAGAFAIWTATRGSLPPRANVFIAFCLGVSLLSFIIWEVFVMITRARNLQKLNPLLLEKLPPKEFLDKLGTLQSEEANSNLLHVSTWIFVLTVCLGAALLALAVLFYNYFAFLVGWPMWPK